MSHTPGPWGYDYSEANKAYEIAPFTKDEDGDSILDWDREVCMTADSNEANARLIAAAPEMLEALKIAHDTMLMDNSGRYTGTRTFRVVLAAILKAEGKP